eukprot:TRINITY_DN8803_c0_g1_i1.p1 TRINITY_DN8803_c0_g1~~TRINITY_DN8803_c0_g1_i1.p1  ORF type:complete len:112 (-),score=25.26 TRINITY_DN8803_c0_g1_i1:213-548(-)
MANKDKDEEFIRKSLEIAKQTMRDGNRPFGALIVAGDGETVLDSFGGAVETTKNATEHAESGLIARVTPKYSQEILSKATLYTSCEPCAMCAGAIYWSGIKRVVFGCSIER